jgi:hypothetical protein
MPCNLRHTPLTKRDFLRGDGGVGNWITERCKYGLQEFINEFKMSTVFAENRFCAENA